MSADEDELVLAPELRSVKLARAFVSRRGRALGVDADTCSEAVLLASEVVTNAIIHGRSEARTYAKSISSWSCEQQLSPEEDEAIEHARP